MERSGAANMNGKYPKNAVAHCHPVQHRRCVSQCENDSLVVSEAILEPKNLSISPENKSSKELSVLIFSSFNPYELKLDSASGKNRQQNANALRDSVFFHYSTCASVRFQVKLETARRAKARDVTASTLMSIIDFDIQNSKSAPLLSTNNVKSAVTVSVNSTADRYDLE